MSDAGIPRNGNPLDDYTADAVVFYRKYRVGPWKLRGWKRLVGQEVPHDAYTDLLTIQGQSIFPAAATDLIDVNGMSAAGGAVSAATNTRELVQIVSGPQTPKAQQPELDLWIPLTNVTHNTDQGKTVQEIVPRYQIKACASACAA